MRKEITEKRVSEYMTLSAPVISPRTSVVEALRIVRGHGFQALPVLEEDRYAGLISWVELMEAAMGAAGGSL